MWRHLLILSLELCKFLGFKQKEILLRTFVQPQFVVTYFYEFQTKAKSHEHICWVSVWSYVILWVSNKSEFLWRHLSSLSLKLFRFTSFKEKESSWRHLLSLSLKLCKFTSFKQKQILMKTFFESQFRVMWVYEFHTKGNSSEDICWVSVWNYVTLSVSNKTEFIWRHLLSLSLKLCKFMSFKPNQIFKNTYVESQFEVM